MKSEKKSFELNFPGYKNDFSCFEMAHDLEFKFNNYLNVE